MCSCKQKEENGAKNLKQKLNFALDSITVVKLVSKHVEEVSGTRVFVVFSSITTYFNTIRILKNI